MSSITDSMIRDFYTSLPSAPQALPIEESETSPLRTRQDPGGSGGGGGSPATSAETGHEAIAAATTAAITEAWRTATAALPTPAEIAAMDDRAYQRIQRDFCAQFWLERYTACPASFFAEFDRWSPQHQTAVTHAVAAFLGVEVGEVDRRWLEARLES